VVQELGTKTQGPVTSFGATAPGSTHLQVSASNSLPLLVQKLGTTAH
jgi:hypothetical protein